MDTFQKSLKQTSCGQCGGSGYINTMGERNCIMCGGSGRNLRTNVIDSPDNWFCNSCNSTGRETFFERITCTLCHGSGTQNY